MEEFLEVVNERGEVLRTLPRSQIHGNPSLLHRVVHVLVFDPEGRLILQKRSLDKDVAPGKWDTSVGGHVNAGETLAEALHREMKEELGIEAQDPEFLYSYIHSNEYESELVYTYRIIYDGEIRFHKREIDEIRPWDLNEIRQSLGKGVFSDNFEHEFMTYMKYLEVSRDENQ